MKGKNYKIVSLYSFFPFQENLILDLKNKLLEIGNESDLSGLLIFASEGINGTICAEKNVIDPVINLIFKYADKGFLWQYFIQFFSSERYAMEKRIYEPSEVIYVYIYNKSNS